ncbi:MAG: radical SAM/SPASM domain-containing protein [Nitrospinota bacterium]
MACGVNIRNTEIGKLVKYPVQRVHMELTNACNFDCVFCPKAVMTRPLGFMKKELAFKFISEISEQKIAEKITFHIMGEPLLHPDFFEILRFCKSKNLPAGLTTNGSFLKGETISKLVDADVHQVSISLQTPDEKSFGLRKSGNLKYMPYMQGVVEFIGKVKKKNKNTIVKIHFLNTRFNKSLDKEMENVDVISDTPTLRAVLKEWAEKIYALDSLQNNGSKEKVMTGIGKVQINKWNVLEIAPKIFLETYILNSWGNAFKGQKVSKAIWGYCSTMQDHFGILHNGNLVLCCKDFDGKTNVGNVSAGSIVELLNTDRVLNVVRGFKKFRVTHPYCKKCLGAKSPSSALLNQAGSVLFMKLLKWHFYKNERLY